MENKQLETNKLNLEGVKRFVVKEGLRRAQEEAEKNNLSFHNAEHTAKVIARYNIILDSFIEFGVYKLEDAEGFEDEENQKLRIVGEMCAAWHDVVQDADEPKVLPEKGTLPSGEPNPYFGKTRTIRNRKFEHNEEESAKALIEFFKEKYPTFFEGDYEEFIRGTILATVPSFNETFGVFQPNIDRDRGNEPSIYAVALALADLGTSGIEKDGFVPDSDKLFLEDNLDIMNAVEDFNNGQDIVEDAQEYFKSRMLRWCEIQVRFPLLRRDRIRVELEPLLREKTDQFINATFPFFEDSSENMNKKLGDRNAMDFFTLAKDMGYEIRSVK